MNEIIKTKNRSLVSTKIKHAWQRLRGGSIEYNLSPYRDILEKIERFDLTRLPDQELKNRGRELLDIARTVDHDASLNRKRMKLNKSFDQTFSKVWPPAGTCREAAYRHPTRVGPAAKRLIATSRAWGRRRQVYFSFFYFPGFALY